MSTFVPNIFAMTSNQWKALNMLKIKISKIANEKSFKDFLVKDFTEYIKKIKLVKIPDSFLHIVTINTISKDKLQEKQEVRTRLIPPVEENTLVVPKTIVRKTEIVKQKWKVPALVSKPSIVSQTNLILVAISEGKTNMSLHSRIEALIEHIKRYPEARLIAVKEGAIRILLKARNKCKGEAQSSLREAFAILGYSSPVPGKGIRILSIDGGGIRGLLVLEMLKKLEELTGKRTYELFDIMCGVSTGSILALAIGIQHKSLQEISQIYEEISSEVFSQSAIWGTGSLVWSHSYYSTTLWEKKLREHLGEFPLIRTARDSSCPKLCTVSAVVNQSRLSAYIFRNYSLPAKVQSQYFGSWEHQVWEAVRASAAAPTYFEEFKLGNYIHQDGGILFNNPTAIALHEAKLIWPTSDIQCVVSFGTGRTVPNPSDSDNSSDTSSNTSWTNKFYKILDSATDTEGVHTMLNDLLPHNVYYRFNPYLTEMVSMVEIEPIKLEQLKRDAVMYLRRNEDKFQAAAKALTEEKTLPQHTLDYINYTRDMYGL